MMIDSNAEIEGQVIGAISHCVGGRHVEPVESLDLGTVEMIGRTDNRSANRRRAANAM